MPGVFPNPLPKPQIPRHHEGSRLRSPRDEDSLGKAWKKNEVASVQITSMQDSIRQLQWQISKTRAYKEQRPPGPGFFPFKIYPSPPDPSGDPSLAWLNYRVRAGAIYYAFGGGFWWDKEVYPEYTDGAGPIDVVAGEYWASHLDPDLPYCPPFDADLIDFTVDSNAITYVFIDNTNKNVPFIDMATTFPGSDPWGSDYILIGTIDTVGVATPLGLSLGSRVKVRQYIRSDITWTGASTQASSAVLYTLTSFNGDTLTCVPNTGKLTSATATAGVNYHVGDKIAVGSLTEPAASPAILQVLTIDGSGMPTSFSILYAGQYFNHITGSFVGLTGTGGRGTGLHLACVFARDTTEVTVAVQPELRQIGSEALEDGTWTYDYNGQTRTATLDDYTENQIITPKFVVGGLIPVWTCYNTGITDVTKIAITGREWAKVYEAPA